MQYTDKAHVFEQLVQLVAAKLQLATRQQRDSQRGAFHEENKAEGSKDTRSTEASYLARGLAQRVADLRHDLALLNKLKLRRFAKDDPVALGALLVVEDDDGLRAYYFIAPGEGGITINIDDVAVRVITTKSPLGRALLGQRLDDEIEFDSPQGRKNLLITQIL